MEPRLHPRLLAWWEDDPSNPDRPSVNNPDVRRLVAEIDRDSQVTDLGGIMSLNVRLDRAGIVLRVHQPFVSRRRLLAVQSVRIALASRGLIVPIPLRWRDATVFRCGDLWAELEAYMAHERAAPTLSSYRWLFAALGLLPRELAPLALTVPRPLIATYAPPGSLRRWLPATEAAVQGDAEAMVITRFLHEQISALRAQWVPANHLPAHLVHGDIRLSNVGRLPDNQAVYMDFGFLAQRPRVHDLAYALAFMVLALGGQHAPDRFAWHSVTPLIAEYESTALVRLTVAERRALASYTAAVPLYAAALDGFSNDPARQLRGRLPFLHLSAWLLAHPDALS